MRHVDLGFLREASTQTDGRVRRPSTEERLDGIVQCRKGLPRKCCRHFPTLERRPESAQKLACSVRLEMPRSRRRLSRPALRHRRIRWRNHILERQTLLAGQLDEGQRTVDQCAGRERRIEHHLVKTRAMVSDRTQILSPDARQVAPDQSSIRLGSVSEENGQTPPYIQGRAASAAGGPLDHFRSARRQTQAVRSGRRTIRAPARRPVRITQGDRAVTYAGHPAHNPACIPNTPGTGSRSRGSDSIPEGIAIAANDAECCIPRALMTGSGKRAQRERRCMKAGNNVSSAGKDGNRGIIEGPGGVQDGLRMGGQRTPLRGTPYRRCVCGILRLAAAQCPDHIGCRDAAAQMAGAGTHPLESRLLRGPPCNSTST